MNTTYIFNQIKPNLDMRFLCRLDNPIQKNLVKIKFPIIVSAGCYLLWTWYQVGSIQCDILSNVQDIFFQVVLFRSGNGWQICLFLVLWRVERLERAPYIKVSFVIVITCVSVAERDERANVVNSIVRLWSFLLVS